MSITTYELNHLDQLEAEAIHIFREVASEFERPCLMFSGGKDSILMLHLATKAFWPARLPFPVLHVDTGHNFPEVIEYRDQRIKELEARLVVASVQKSIDEGRVTEEKGPRASRNRLQTTTLLDSIEENKFDALFGGARRDEEKARAKERFFSHRDEFGQWDPKNQRPGLWNLYNAKINKENVEVIIESPEKKELNEKRFLMSSFYMNQRKKLNILIDDENKPVGGKWSLDAENRKKLPKKITIPKVLIHDYDVLSLKNNTEKISNQYNSNYGNLDSFNYPINRLQASKALLSFLQTKIIDIWNHNPIIGINK